MIKIQAIKAFSDNYIWCLYNEQSKQCAVVDPGDAKPVLETLKAKGLTLSAIIITHHHFDHTGGIDDLLNISAVPVYGPENPAISQITQRLKGGDKASILGLTFDILAIPGHTLDHIAFYTEDTPDQPSLFCGDTLFAGGCGRVFEGDPDMMLNSLNQLAALPSSSRVFCAHEYTLSNLQFAQAVEPDNKTLQERFEHDSLLRQKDQPTVPSTLSIELATNPFLRCHYPQVKAIAESRADNQCHSDSEVFAAIREWKDSF